MRPRRRVLAPVLALRVRVHPRRLQLLLVVPVVAVPPVLLPPSPTRGHPLPPRHAPHTNACPPSC